MAKLPILSWQQVMRALHRRGFHYAPKRGKGSHVALVGTDATGQTRLVIIPRRKYIPAGTLQAILEQAGITRQELLELL